MLHHSPVSTSPLHGTPNAQLRAMSETELRARYLEIRTAQAAPNYVPSRLRVAPSESARRAHSILQNERNRIRRIASERGLDLEEKQTAAYVHAAYTTSERDPYGLPEKGDTVDTEFRDPDTGEIVRGRGIVESIENGKLGAIYQTRVNGKLYPLSKRGIRKIIFDS